MSPTSFSHRALRRLALAVCTLTLLGIGWLTLGPRSLGGPNTYLLTSGTSMLPTIQPRSAVVVRQEPAYHVGEIVAYRNPDIGDAMVMHRIVKRDGARYVFKGDNNQFADFYEPTGADIIGAKVFYSHGLGQAMSNLRTPMLGGLLLGLVSLWILWPTKADTKSASDGSDNEADAKSRSLTHQ